MAYQTIIVAKEEENLGVLTLNRPDALNALNSKMVDEIISALRGFECDDDVRCVILTGSERAFCAGADIREMSAQSTVDMIRTNHFFPLWRSVGTFPKPIIAAL